MASAFVFLDSWGGSGTQALRNDTQKLHREVGKEQGVFIVTQISKENPVCLIKKTGIRDAVTVLRLERFFKEIEGFKFNLSGEFCFTAFIL